MMVYVLPGVVLAGVGFVILFSLVASVGALEKSRQLAALGHLASGRAGSGKRALTFVAIALLFFGSCAAFGGVAASDARRARACLGACAAKGHPSGKIGPSEARHPQKPNAAAFVACKCSGGPGSPVDLPADSL